MSSIRYQAELARCGPVRLIDLQDVNKQVPLPVPPPHLPPVFVLGGKDDVVVDTEVGLLQRVCSPCG